MGFFFWTPRFWRVTEKSRCPVKKYPKNAFRKKWCWAVFRGPRSPLFFPSCLRPAAYNANCDFPRGPRIETGAVFERWPAIWTRRDCAPLIWRGDGFLEPVVFRDVKSVSCFYPFRDRRFRILRANPSLRNIIFRVRSRTHRFPRGDIGRY